MNAPPIPLNQLNGGFNSGLPNPLQSGGPRGGRGQNLGGVGRPNGFASGGGVGRQFGAGSAAPTTQLMNGLNGGDYANAAARGLGSEVSNREFGPTSNNSPIDEVLRRSLQSGSFGSEVPLGVISVGRGR